MERYYPRVIHRKDALRLLSDHHPHRLRLWKFSTGEILLYPRAVRIGAHQRGGMVRVQLQPSGEIRTFHEFCLFEIDDILIHF